MDFSFYVFSLKTLKQLQIVQIIIPVSVFYCNRSRYTHPLVTKTNPFLILVLKLMIKVFSLKMISSVRKYGFWTLGLSEGVLCNHPCPSAVRGLWSVFKYSRGRSLVFSNFLHEVRAP